MRYLVDMMHGVSLFQQVSDEKRYWSTLSNKRRLVGDWHYSSCFVCSAGLLVLSFDHGIRRPYSKYYSRIMVVYICQLVA